MRVADFSIVIFIISLIMLCVNGRKNTTENDGFSSDTMFVLKGIFSIMIVLFHLSQHIDGGWFFKIIGQTGCLSVAVFYFISGYGMYTRVLQTGGGVYEEYPIKTNSEGVASMDGSHFNICNLLVSRRRNGKDFSNM